MSFQASEAYREWLAKLHTGEVSVPAQLVVGLFWDVEDDLSRGDDLAAIESEPADGSYARQTLGFDAAGLTADANAGYWRVIAEDVAFDVTDTTATVDGYFVAWDAQLAGDDAPTTHLMSTGPLRHEYDLAAWPRETFTLRRVSVTFND